jgi:hypothetical protein
MQTFEGEGVFWVGKHWVGNSMLWFCQYCMVCSLSAMVEALHIYFDIEVSKSIMGWMHSAGPSAKVLGSLSILDITSGPLPHLSYACSQTTYLPGPNKRKWQTILLNRGRYVLKPI